MTQRHTMIERFLLNAAKDKTTDLKIVSSKVVLLVISISTDAWFLSLGHIYVFAP